MPQFTPGPWDIDDGDSGVLGVFALDGNAVCYLSEYVISGQGLRGAETDQANAQLIAAAPEMYEALVFIKNFFDKLEDGLPADDPISELRHKVHAPVHLQLDTALAKAEGKS